MPSVPHVIWVVQWYPHEGELYAGDFIQRHAKAASLFLPVHVYACFPHTHVKQTIVTHGNLTEHIAYFKPVKTGIRSLNKIADWWTWNRQLKREVGRHIKLYGKPDLIHCHITLNTGWLGLWAKRRHGIPFLVTEHWSGFMPGAVDGFNRYNPWSKRMLHRIIRQSLVITTVSNALAKVLQQIEKQGTYIRLPNVVDETIFHFDLSAKKEGKFRLLHISTFSPQKNMAAMLAGFDELIRQNAAVEFHIVGPKKIFEERFPLQAGSTYYKLHDEMPQPELAALMHQCNACVLYSHYETFGCVIIEANACGIPVIVADIPVFREIVQDGENGLLVKPDHPTELATAIQSMISGPNLCDPALISKNTIREFCFETVGKQLYDLYQNLTASSKE